MVCWLPSHAPLTASGSHTSAAQQLLLLTQLVGELGAANQLCLLDRSLERGRVRCCAQCHEPVSYSTSR